MDIWNLAALYTYVGVESPLGIANVAMTMFQNAEIVNVANSCQ